MREQLRAAGIGPGEDLKGILEEHGFTVGPPGAPGVPPGPPPVLGVEVMDALESFIGQYEAGTLTEDDVGSLVEVLKQAGVSPRGVLLDVQG